MPHKYLGKFSCLLFGSRGEQGRKDDFSYTSSIIQIFFAYLLNPTKFKVWNVLRLTYKKFSIFDTFRVLFNLH